MGTTRSSNNKSSISNVAPSVETYVRKAKHAGSWYSSSEKELDNQLSSFSSRASSSGTQLTTSSKTPFAIIGPHAGYSYSGPTAAYAYLAVEKALSENEDISTIVVLHPSHYVYLDGCAISNATQIETPIATLQVNSSLKSRLIKTNEFRFMTKNEDETEHSGEMHYPFIAKILKKLQKLDSITVLPIMIGSINKKREEYFGSEVLEPILSSKQVFTVISSDFCHWGNRFQYTPYSQEMKIHEYIKWLDHLGMSQIELQNPGSFCQYLKEYKNTICGRHPISVWLFSLKNDRDSEVKFVHYDQSSQVESFRDSSVSYASAVASR